MLSSCRQSTAPRERAGCASFEPGYVLCLGIPPESSIRPDPASTGVPRSRRVGDLSVLRQASLLPSLPHRQGESGHSEWEKDRYEEEQGPGFGEKVLEACTGQERLADTVQRVGNGEKPPCGAQAMGHGFRRDETPAQQS